MTIIEDNNLSLIKLSIYIVKIRIYTIGFVCKTTRVLFIFYLHLVLVTFLTLLNYILLYYKYLLTFNLMHQIKIHQNFFAENLFFIFEDNLIVEPSSVTLKNYGKNRNDI